MSVCGVARGWECVGKVRRRKKNGRGKKRELCVVCVCAMGVEIETQNEKFGVWRCQASCVKGGGGEEEKDGRCEQGRRKRKGCGFWAVGKQRQNSG